KGLDHLHSDVATADDDGPSHPRVDHGLDAVHVREVAQGVHQWAVHAGDGGLQRCGTGGEHEFVVGLGVGAAAVDVPHREAVGSGVDGHDFVADPDVECQVVREA